MDLKLIAREKECAALDRCMESPRSEFVIICGRRRVGKTYLVEQYFKNQYDFSFVGMHKADTRLQLRNFAKALKKYSGKSEYKFNDWFDAFDALEEYLEGLQTDRKKVIFIDEMPWIDTMRSDFVNALENFWNSWANRCGDIMLVASGSATSWMADKLEENQGGLHNRITEKLFLAPFTLKETEEYLNYMGFSWDRYQILQCYMFTGGVPFYLSLLKSDYSVAQNIDQLCFEPNATLKNEFGELYNALFSHAESYIEVVRILNKNKKGMTKNELVKECKLTSSMLKKVLINLERCDFITRMAQFGKRKDSIYRLTDNYTLFYFKFIENNMDWDDQWWVHHLDSQSVLSWQGLTFELICIRHHKQIKQKLGISGMATSVSTWQCKPDQENNLPGAQIDMIIDRADRMIHLCEMKFSKSPYYITPEYEDKLRTRMSVFNYKTKNRKSLVHTFVTTYGIAMGKRHGLVHSEVTMDDLFAI